MSPLLYRNAHHKHITHPRNAHHKHITHPRNAHHKHITHPRNAHHKHITHPRNAHHITPTLTCVQSNSPEMKHVLSVFHSGARWHSQLLLCFRVSIFGPDMIWEHDDCQNPHTIIKVKRAFPGDRECWQPLCFHPSLSPPIVAWWR